MSLCCCGDFLGLTNQILPGNGVYVRNNRILASLSGQVIMENPADGEDKPRINVERVGYEAGAAIVPEIGGTVTAQIVRVNPRYANCKIVCVGSKVAKEPFNGMIRSQDVRTEEIDKVEIYKSFRPGDIVLAQVISLGDSRNYYLSTARTDLGVIHALSVAGLPMVALSKQEMQCPKTKTVEYRKVAQREEEAEQEKKTEN